MLCPASEYPFALRTFEWPLVSPDLDGLSWEPPSPKAAKIEEAAAAVIEGKEEKGESKDEKPLLNGHSSALTRLFTEGKRGAAEKEKKSEQQVKEEKKNEETDDEEKENGIAIISGAAGAVRPKKKTKTAATGDAAAAAAVPKRVYPPVPPLEGIPVQLEFNLTARRFCFVHDEHTIEPDQVCMCL